MQKRKKAFGKTVKNNTKMNFKIIMVIALALLVGCAHETNLQKSNNDMISNEKLQEVVSKTEFSKTNEQLKNYENIQFYTLNKTQFQIIIDSNTSTNIKRYVATLQRLIM